MQTLKGKHKGSPIVVIGGGSFDPATNFDGCVIVGCNHHYIDANYLVYLDNPFYNKKLKKFLDDFKGVSIGRYGYRRHPDYFVTNKFLGKIHAKDTGDLGIWFAGHIGDDIQLVGFDRKVGSWQAA